MILANPVEKKDDMHDYAVRILNCLPTDLSAWDENKFRQSSFDVHSETKSILFFWDGVVLKNRESDLGHAVWSAADHVSSIYGGGISKIMLAMIPSKKCVKKHRDTNELEKIHRTHIPIVTHKNVDFFVRDGNYNMEFGILYELSNCELHGVTNNSDVDRIHLIVDVF